MRCLNQWSVQKALVFHATHPMHSAALQPNFFKQWGQYLNRCLDAKKENIKKKKKSFNLFFIFLSFLLKSSEIQTKSIYLYILICMEDVQNQCYSGHQDWRFGILSSFFHVFSGNKQMANVNEEEKERMLTNLGVGICLLMGHQYASIIRHSLLFLSERKAKFSIFLRRIVHDCCLAPQQSPLNSNKILGIYFVWSQRKSILYILTSRVTSI